MKTLNKILIFIAIFICIFIVAMTVIFCVKGSVPDTLITCVLGGSSIELFLSAWITVAKKKYYVEQGWDKKEDEVDS